MSETTNAAEDTARIRAESPLKARSPVCAWTPRSPVPSMRRAPGTSGWIRDGHVTVTNNGKTVKIGKSYKLSAGDEVVVDAPAPRDLADIRPEKVDGFRIVHLGRRHRCGGYPRCPVGRTALQGTGRQGCCGRGQGTRPEQPPLNSGPEQVHEPYSSKDTSRNRLSSFSEGSRFSYA